MIIFSFVRNMKDWVFRTTTRSVEIINIALLAHLTYVLDRHAERFVSLVGYGFDYINTPILMSVAAAMAAAQFTGLLSDSCSRCRRFSGFVLVGGAVVWLFVGSVVLLDSTAAIELGLGKSFSGVYFVFATLCYLAAEVIGEYIKSRME